MEVKADREVMVVLEVQEVLEAQEDLGVRVVPELL